MSRKQYDTSSLVSPRMARRNTYTVKSSLGQSAQLGSMWVALMLDRVWLIELWKSEQQQQAQSQKVVDTCGPNFVQIDIYLTLIIFDFHSIVDFPLLFSRLAINCMGCDSVAGIRFVNWLMCACCWVLTPLLTLWTDREQGLDATPPSSPPTYRRSASREEKNVFSRLTSTTGVTRDEKPGHGVISQYGGRVRRL